MQSRILSKGKYNFIDLFAGAGGLSEGFVQAGFNPIAHVEMNPFAAQTLVTRSAYYYLKQSKQLDIYYQYLRGKITQEEFLQRIPNRITKTVICETMSNDTLPGIFKTIDGIIKIQNIQKVDVVIGGPPCQAYSLVGRAQSKVLWQEANTDQIMDDAQECLYEVFSLAFTGKATKNTGFSIVQAIVTFWEDGNKDTLLQIVNEYRKYIFNSYSPQTWFWGEIVCAVTKVISDASARILLPMYSALDIKNWEDYFKRKSSINLLWASQRLVGTSKIFHPVFSR